MQGFVRYILDEVDGKCRELMQAAHAVLLCEMERGVLDWSHTSRNERIR